MGILSQGAKIAKRVKKPTPSPLPKKPSTPAQRAFGGGRQIGKKIGRKQGAAAGAAAGLTVAAIREMTNRNKLEKLKQENITATQKAAVEETLRKLAQEELKNTRTVGPLNQSPRPKLRPEGNAKGGYKTKKKMKK